MICSQNDSSSQQFVMLSRRLESTVGHCIKFDNGCELHLSEEDGLYWATNPYGGETAFKAEQGWQTQVSEWLRFWDEPRDEFSQFRDKC